jgi:hypothetical protein
MIERVPTSGGGNQSPKRCVLKNKENSISNKDRMMNNVQNIIFVYVSERSWGSSVGIATGYGLDVQAGSGLHPVYCPMGASGVSRQGVKPITHLQPSAEFKNGEPPLLHTSLLI